jgi:hypothetical protein
MTFINRSLIEMLTLSSILIGSSVAQPAFGIITSRSFNNLLYSVDSTVSIGSQKLSLLQSDNKEFNTREEAFNAIKDRGRIPRSQANILISQWSKGNETAKAGSGGYIVNKDRPASWGNYFVYKVSNQYFVVAEHTSDPNAPCPTGWSKPCKHFHIGTAGTASSSFTTSKTPDAAAIEFFRSSDYTQIQPDHHFFYKNN